VTRPCFTLLLQSSSGCSRGLARENDVVSGRRGGLARVVEAGWRGAEGVVVEEEKKKKNKKKIKKSAEIRDQRSAS
jgi:hypothetical protein